MVNLLASAAALLVNLVCYWLDSRCYRRFTRAVEAGFRMALVQKLQVLSMKFHNSKQSGKVLSKLVSDVQFIQILIYDRFLEILLLCEDVVFIIVVALTSFPMMLLFYALIIPGAVILLRRFSRPLLDRRAELRRETEQANAAVMELAFRYLKINASMYIPLLFVNILRLCIQGMGFTRVAMFAGLAEMIARTVVAVWVVPAAGFTGACFANPAAWVMADLFLFPCYFQLIRNVEGRLMPNLRETKEKRGAIIRLRKTA